MGLYTKKELKTINDENKKLGNKNLEQVAKRQRFIEGKCSLYDEQIARQDGAIRDLINCQNEQAEVIDVLKTMIKSLLNKIHDLEDYTGLTKERDDVRKASEELTEGTEEDDASTIYETNGDSSSSAGERGEERDDNDDRDNVIADAIGRAGIEAPIGEGYSS